MKDLYKIKAKIFKKYDTRYIKISKNQLRILESLYLDGSKEKKYFDNKGKLRYTEHSGLLDFGKSRLQRIIINAKQNISDKLDNTILLPENMPDAIDFEYIFHTHPSTPNPGSRISEGILYEFPSVSDLFHFIDHHNQGRTQGSIIIAPEGMYIIKSIKSNLRIDIKNENKVINSLEFEIDNIQKNALKKYGVKISKNTFYKKIAKDLTFIDKYNKLIKNLNLKIFYRPRILLKKKWILDDLYLKVSPIE
tara:strand:- start:2727 stop:3476 length:750 start_codon:yes stop_codon:yes gene_type:complete